MKKETTLKDTQKVKIIKEQEEKDLLNFINDMPTKFGLPLLKFLEGLDKIEHK
jgi:hypothetical protein